ncbi:U6 snRNA-associated Sm-like protein LSm4 [Cercospora zeina]
MLPLGLLTAAQGHPMLVELKTGETLNGHLVSCDTYMNITLKEVVQTSPEGDKFFRLPECYVRGNNIKYLRVPDEVVELVKDQQANHQQQQQQQHQQQQGQRGGRGGANGVGEKRVHQLQRRCGSFEKRRHDARSTPAEKYFPDTRLEAERRGSGWLSGGLFTPGRNVHGIRYSHITEREFQGGP